MSEYASTVIWQENLVKEKPPVHERERQFKALTVRTSLLSHEDVIREFQVTLST